MGMYIVYQFIVHKKKCANIIDPGCPQTGASTHSRLKSLYSSSYLIMSYQKLWTCTQFKVNASIIVVVESIIYQLPLTYKASVFDTLLARCACFGPRHSTLSINAAQLTLQRQEPFFNVISYDTIDARCAAASMRYLNYTTTIAEFTPADRHIQINPTNLCSGIYLFNYVLIKKFQKK